MFIGVRPWFYIVKFAEGSTTLSYTTGTPRDSLLIIYIPSSFRCIKQRNIFLDEPARAPSGFSATLRLGEYAKLTDLIAHKLSLLASCHTSDFHACICRS